ncbi:Sister chromatid cohesion protein 2, partial [Coemansia sp. RSA 2611]
MPFDAPIAGLDPTATVPGAVNAGQLSPLLLKRNTCCDSEDDKHVAKRQRPTLVHRESTGSDIVGSVHSEAVPEQIISLSSLALSAGTDSHDDQGGDTATCALPSSAGGAGLRDAAADQPPAHIGLLDAYLAKLFQDEDRISDCNGIKPEYFNLVSRMHGDAIVLNKRAVRQLRLLFGPCSSEQLAKHVPSDEIGRVVCMLVAVVEVADVMELADMVKSGALVAGETGLSAVFSESLDQALSNACLALDASSLIADLAATGKAPNGACPGDSLHAAVTLFKDCLLGCAIPLLDLGMGCALADALANTDGILRGRLLAFLGTVLAAHAPLTALATGPTLAEQDVISLVFASISATFCTSDLLGSDTGANILESIRRAAQVLLRRVFEVYTDQRPWILEEILASLIKLPTPKRSQSAYRIAGGKSVQFISVLLLKLLQGTAQSPEDLTAGFEGRRLPAKECRMLLQKHKKAVDAASSSTDFVIRYLIGR